MDDVVGDKELKSFQSQLCGFSTMCRHSYITCIYLVQSWTCLPSTIRRNSNLVFLLTCDNFSQSMMEENCLKNKHKDFQLYYETNIIDPKDYSFLIVDKSAPNNK